MPPHMVRYAMTCLTFHIKHMFALWTSMKLEMCAKMPKWEPVSHSDTYITESGIFALFSRIKHIPFSFLCTFRNHWLSFPIVWAAAPLGLTQGLNKPKGSTKYRKITMWFYHMSPIEGLKITQFII